MIKDSKKIDEEIKKQINEMSLKECYEMFNQDNLSIYPYSLNQANYENHTLVEKYIPINISEEVLKTVADNQNEFIKENFYIYSANNSVPFVSGYYLSAGTLGYDYNNKDLERFNDSFSYTVDLMSDFINKNKDEKIDPTKKCYAIELNIVNPDYIDTAFFFTNKTDEVDEIIKEEISITDNEFLEQ